MYTLRTMNNNSMRRKVLMMVDNKHILLLEGILHIEVRGGYML